MRWVIILLALILACTFFAISLVRSWWQIDFLAFFEDIKSRLNFLLARIDRLKEPIFNDATFLGSIFRRIGLH